MLTTDNGNSKHYMAICASGITPALSMIQDGCVMNQTVRLRCSIEIKIDQCDVYG